MTTRWPVLLWAALIASIHIEGVSTAGILSYTPTSCLSRDTLAAPIDQQLIFTRVYAQFDQGQTAPGQLDNGYGLATTGQPPIYDSQGLRYNSTGTQLRVVLVGTTTELATGYSNQTTFLSTVDVNANVLSFPIYSNQSALCAGIRTTSGTTSGSTGSVGNSGCPYQGDIALGFSVVLGSSYAATSISTRLLVLDPSVPARHLACYDLEFTPYYPKYFVYPLILFFVIGLLAFYLLLYVIARVYAAYTVWLQDNETHLASSLTLKLSSNDGSLSRRKMWGAIWFNAWAGREVVASGSLRRYGTAELREIFAMIQWATLVGTVAVSWPNFIYPIFAQTAWTTLVYNSTLPFTSRPAPLLPSNFTRPPLFASQMADLTSPLYLDQSLPNVLLDLENSTRGLERWARSIGVRAQDVWSVCAFTFYVICAIIILAHLIFFIFDLALDTFRPSRYSKRRISKDGPPSTTGKAQEASIKNGLSSDNSQDDRHAASTLSTYRPASTNTSRYPLIPDEDLVDDNVFLREEEEAPRPEDVIPSWRLHLASLHGNLLRALLFFHLPLSIFSIYVLAHRSEINSTSEMGLAGATFAVVCILIPAYSMWRIYSTNIRTLYSSLTHLLELGPLYNAYADECTLFAGVRLGSNLVIAIVIGAVQGTGTAQAAVFLAVEITDTLATSLWLPWGENAAMGPLAFGMSLARIIIAVLLVVLSPTVAVGPQARSWIAYVVLIVQALIALLLLWVLVFKFFEIIVRLVGGVPFDESRSSRAGGLFGALRRWDRGQAGGGPTAGNRRKKRMTKSARDRAAAREATMDSSINRRSLDRMSQNRQGTGSERRLLPPGAGKGGYRGGAHDDDGGYIMSSMSTGRWSQAAQAKNNEIKPGAYSSSGPVLRSGPNWGEARVVPAATTSSGSTGFQRVGGGRATYANPYELAGSPERAAEYPPYPASSADVYKAPGNPRRLSQSAVIEMASAGHEDEVAPAHPPPRNSQRPSMSLAPPPSSSNLLSNTASRFDTPVGISANGHTSNSRNGTAAKPQAGGFFGRFKNGGNRPVTSDDSDSDDDTDDEDEAENQRRKRTKGGLFGIISKRMGKSKENSKAAGVSSAQEGEEEQEVLAEPEEKGFSVVRKPRARPQPAANSTTSERGETPDEPARAL